MKKFKHTKRREQEDPKLEMTPMIDVVFQLLIFFVVTLKVEDILGHLDVARPAPDPEAKPEEIQDLLDIVVHKNGYALRGRRVSLAHLDSQLTRLASFSKNVSVVIRCTNDSPHENLIHLLDVCSKAGAQESFRVQYGLIAGELTPA